MDLFKATLESGELAPAQARNPSAAPEKTSIPAEPLGAREKNLSNAAPCLK
jgi:hypothetical protein